MIEELQTRVGRIMIGEVESLFERAIDLVEKKVAGSNRDFGWALTGGTTPAAFYRACLEGSLISESLMSRAVWTTSDERFVPLESRESNFGNAARQLLDPLGVRENRRIPWPTDLHPQEAVTAYGDRWSGRMGGDRAYDVCFLGMGDDGHTASLFPGEPLLKTGPGGYFSAVDVPGKGWRLTITVEGIMRSGLVVVMALGRGKAEALRDVVHGGIDPLKRPARLFRRCADRVVWLVDREAAYRIEKR